LVHGLLDSQFVAYAAVLTEKCPSLPNVETLRKGRLDIYRRFPFRAGVSGRSFVRYFQYLWQNLCFLALPWMVYRLGISHLLIHSSFHNHPNFMWLAVLIIRELLPSVKLISDVRDPKLPESRFGEIKLYHWVICCSENVHQRLAKNASLTNKLVTIPIVIDIDKPSHTEIAECKKRYGLELTPYLFNGSGISWEKGIAKALDVINQIRNVQQDLCLVVAGRKRDWSKCHDDAVKSGALCYVGIIPHRDVFILSAGAEIDVNFSHVDSMPRATLEALAAGAKVLLPKGIPEFDRSCSEYVVASDCSQEIAKQVQLIISRNEFPNYDMQPHAPASVYRQYSRLFHRDEVNDVSV